jgi:hypothetical protein
LESIDHEKPPSLHARFIFDSGRTVSTHPSAKNPIALSEQARLNPFAVVEGIIDPCSRRAGESEPAGAAGIPVGIARGGLIKRRIGMRDLSLSLSAPAELGQRVQLRESKWRIE